VVHELLHTNHTNKCKTLIKGIMQQIVEVNNVV